MKNLLIFAGVFRSRLRTVAASLVSLVFLACSDRQVEMEWIEFSPPGGRFTVQMPSEPNEDISKSESGKELRSYQIVTALNRIRAMAVSYAPQPFSTSALANSAAILNSSRDNALRNLNGRLQSQKEIKSGAFPGLEFQMVLPKGNVVIQRNFLANDRIYSLMVVTLPKNVDAPEVSRFFDSFRILK